MNISTLVLYGSCARGDNNSTSDVDLFALTTSDDYRMVVKSKINLAMYPKSLAIDMAKRGELFMLHIVEEGKPLIDLNGEFRSLRESFVYRKSYAHEISNAGGLGWAIRRFGSSVRNQALVNRRIAWCVRTVLIAKAAEEEKAIFSAEALTHFAADDEVRHLILNKNEDRLQTSIYPIFERFLLKWTGPPPLLERETVDAYQALFKNQKNIVGLKTFKAFQNDKNYDDYLTISKMKKKLRR